MCGIAGFVTKTQKLGPGQLLQVSKTLRHRGPDDEGFLFIGSNGKAIEVFSGEFGKPDFIENVKSFGEIEPLTIETGLLHRRLSIIAPENEGHQPMTDLEKKIWLVFNGEIYNYLSLREELKKEGCIFKTRTDSEVLLQAYKIWGVDCLSRLDGMWSFAILDLNKNQLFASTDRTGIKPFYYHKDETGFCFSSEIKAFKNFGIEFSENKSTVSRYLAFGLSDESSQTLFQNITRLQAGKYLILDLKTEEVQIQNYHQWRVNQNYDFQPFIKESEQVEQIRNLLLEMISLRLQSDVPLGVCLSGGIDSSTIAGLTAYADKISKNSGVRKAFMAVLPKGSFGDESHFAKMMAEKSGFEFFSTEPQASEFVTSFENLIYTMDEPPPGLNAFSQYEVFRKVAKEGVKVTLDGQGADEIFAGYPRHHESNLAEGLKHSVCQFGSLVAGKEALLNYLRSGIGSKNSAALLNQYKPETAIFNPMVFELAGEKGNFYNSVNQGLINEFNSSSLPFLLKAADRNSMRWSIESRMPFADFTPLVQYLFETPGSAKIQNGFTKSLLRKAASPFVPHQILNRKDKVGFAAPNMLWLNQLYKDKSLELLKVDSEFVDFKTLEKYRTKILGNMQIPDFQIFWRVLAYLEWKKIFFKS